MTILIIGILLVLVGLYLTFFGVKKNLKIITHNAIQKQENEKLKKDKTSLQEEYNYLVKILSTLQEQQEEKKVFLRENYYQYCEELDRAYSSKEELFDNKVKTLEVQLQQKKNEIDEEYTIFLKNLGNSYELTQEETLKLIEENKKELDKWKNTRAATLEAQRREQEIELQSDFYRVHITESERITINLINELKPRLPEPRVLSMLVWQTFYQKKMKDLCTKILGTKTKSGIYKITNLKTGMCYIGQTVNADTRWKDHAKCGLGIDTPVGNKLYQAMLKDGLDSFTFEFLEEVPAATLNEKEKFYIDLYDSCNFGYNSTKGNK